MLIVDSNLKLAKTLAKALSTQDIQTFAAGSGEEALEFLGRRSVDLVITDLIMPGMGGLALVREVKSRTPGTKAMIVTAHTAAEDEEAARALGVRDYLVKPFDLARLRSRVRRLLVPRRVCEGPLGILRKAVWATGTVAGGILRVLAATWTGASRVLKPR